MSAVRSHSSTVAHFEQSAMAGRFAESHKEPKSFNLSLKKSDSLDDHDEDHHQQIMRSSSGKSEDEVRGASVTSKILRESIASLCIDNNDDFDLSALDSLLDLPPETQNDLRSLSDQDLRSIAALGKENIDKLLTILSKVYVEKSFLQKTELPDQIEKDKKLKAYYLTQYESLYAAVNLIKIPEANKLLGLEAKVLSVAGSALKSVSSVSTIVGTVLAGLLENSGKVHEENRANTLLSRLPKTQGTALELEFINDLAIHLTILHQARMSNDALNHRMHQMEALENLNKDAEQLGDQAIKDSQGFLASSKKAVSNTVMSSARKVGLMSNERFTNNKPDEKISAFHAGLIVSYLADSENEAVFKTKMNPDELIDHLIERLAGSEGLNVIHGNKINQRIESKSTDKKPSFSNKKLKDGNYVPLASRTSIIEKNSISLENESLQKQVALNQK